MRRLRLKLVFGKDYLFTHRRLRTLKARFVGIVRAPGNDPMDEYYLECDISDLDTAVRPPSLRNSDTVMLRASMISMVQDVPAGYSPRVSEFASPMQPRRGRPRAGVVHTMKRFLNSVRRRLA